MGQVFEAGFHGNVVDMWETAVEYMLDIHSERVMVPIHLPDAIVYVVKGHAFQLKKGLECVHERVVVRGVVKCHHVDL